MTKRSVKGKACSVAGCDAPAKVHAGDDPACLKHYQRWVKFGTCTPDHCDRDLIHSSKRVRSDKGGVRGPRHG